MPKRAKRANSATTIQKSMLVIVLCVIVQVLVPYRDTPCVPYAFLLVAVEFSSDAVYLKVLRWGRKAEKEILGLECPIGFAHLGRSVTIVVRGCNYPLASAEFCDSHCSSSCAFIWVSVFLAKSAASFHSNRIASQSRLISGARSFLIFLAPLCWLLLFLLFAQG